MYYFKKCSGHCPTQDDDYAIEVKFLEFKQLNAVPTQYKATMHICEYAHEHKCDYILQGNPPCPIVKNAKFTK